MLSPTGANYGGRWKACVTAGVCEPMLLTLGNEEQTRTKRIEGGMEGGRGESKREGSSGERDGDSCSTIKVIKTHKANGWLDDGGICVYLNTAVEWKVSVEVRL